MNNTRYKLYNLTFIITILILTVVTCTAFASKSNKWSDTNADGLTDTVMPYEKKSSESFNPDNINIKIGIIEAGTSMKGLTDRLESIGYSNVETISHTKARNLLNSYDVIAFAVSWAGSQSATLDSIFSDSMKYLDFVNQGGGLFIEQPNPFAQRGNQITIPILPVPVTFDNGYIKTDTVMIVDPTHPITKDLPWEGMPFPGDQVKNLDKSYHVLVKGRQTNSPGLFVTEYGKGRILLHMAHHSPGAIWPISDEVYIRMLDWTAGDVTSSVFGTEHNAGYFELSQNYPNPFNPITTIQFTIPSSEEVFIEIFNLLGEEKRILVNEFLQPGNYKTTFDASNLPSGVYFYRIQAGKFSDTKKLIILK